jgi:hypothetical protein
VLAGVGNMPRDAAVFVAVVFSSDLVGAGVGVLGMVHRRGAANLGRWLTASSSGSSRVWPAISCDAFTLQMSLVGASS